MALVMLPCEFPWWSQVQKLLGTISATKNTLELVEGMQKIHNMCNVSLDPDEDENPDPQLFVGLLNFLDNDFTTEERCNFFNKILPNITTRATNLKKWKPKAGLHFSLQQQGDSTEMDRNFISSLIANAFFSTFPRRNDKTHPTLKNFNFSGFFRFLNTATQKAKLRALFHYFDWLDDAINEPIVSHTGTMKIMRQVMTSREWLTIEDWLECTLPLCSLQIKHAGRLDRIDGESLLVCFANSKIGGNVLLNGCSQECITLMTFPEMLPIILFVEALEDNEVITVQNATQITRISDPKHRGCVERTETRAKTTVCCVDAEDYSKIPASQYEEDNILRELNKCLLAFQQKQLRTKEILPEHHHRPRRLSPIGESMGSGELAESVPMITQQSCSTTKSDSSLDNSSAKYDRLRVRLEGERNLERKGHVTTEGMLNNRRGRFIVLGSSGECLPIKRISGSSGGSVYSSCSSSDEYQSARSSLEESSDDEECNKRYNADLTTDEKRRSFAQRLKDALRTSISHVNSSTESSYAVGISITGSGIDDKDISLRRGGSTGFILKQDTMDEDYLQESLNQDREWMENVKKKQLSSKRDSDYSFSTDFSSELEEVYEQFSKWLEDPILETDKGTKRQLDSRDLAVVQFAGSLLKRTLSESFAGVPYTETCGSVMQSNPNQSGDGKKKKIVLSARSLSLELARQKHRLAAQLAKLQPKDVKFSRKKQTQLVVSWVTHVVQTLEETDISISIPKPIQISQIANKPKGGLKAVSTGNWGCGTSKCGETQLKLVVQWLAASVAGAPSLIYYTSGHQQLASLDTVYRLLRDRKWTVKDLAEATLRFSVQALLGKQGGTTLFDDIIGVERTA